MELDLLTLPESTPITLEVSPFAYDFILKGKDPLSSREAMVLNLLRVLKSFNQKIEDARKIIDLKNIVPFPEHVTIEKLVKLEWENISSESRTKLIEETTKILKHYRLGENWRQSIVSVILTNHFPIPYESSPVNYHFPIQPKQNPIKSEPKNIRDLKNGFLDNLMHQESALSFIHQAEIIKYPSIYFTSRITTTNLISWIRKNKKLIDHMNTYLPEETNAGSKLDIRTERVALVAIIYKQEGLKNDWARMEAELLKWDDRSKDGISDFFGDEGLPTAEELRLCFKSYMEVIRKLEQNIES